MHSSRHELTNGILIDFDHAVVMEPGRTTPPSCGLRLEGTLPFIAREMEEDEPERPFKRLFRHDLESVVWCMVWYVSEQPNWLQGTFTEICAKRHAWYCHIRHSTLRPRLRKGAEHLWGPVVDIAGAWMRTEFALEEPDETDWLGIVSSRLSCPSHLGTEWMTFQVPRNKVRRKDRSRAR